MDSIPQKQCPRCKQDYLATRDFFTSNKNGKNGLNCYCKKCAAEIQREYRKANPDKVRATESKRDKEKRRLQEQERLKDPVYREKRNARTKRKYAKNPQKQKDYWHQYRLGYPEKVAISQRNWIKNNPERVRLHSHKKNQNRRVQIANAEGRHTVNDLKAIHETQEGLCAYCGQRVFLNLRRDTHVDHIQPLSRGGSNWPDNLAITCHSCNESKADKTISEWMVIRGW